MRKRDKQYNPRKNNGIAYAMIDRLKNGGSPDDHRYSSVMAKDSFNMPILEFISRMKTGYIIKMRNQISPDEYDIVILKRLYIASFIIADIAMKQRNSVILDEVQWLRCWLDSVFNKMLQYVVFHDGDDGYDYSVDTAFEFKPLSTTGIRLSELFNWYIKQISAIVAYEYAELKYNGVLNLEKWCNLETRDKPFLKLIKVDVFRKQLENVLSEQGYFDE